MRGAVPAPSSEPRRPIGIRGLVLDAPEWLPDEARPIFEEAARDLAATGTLKPGDRHGLAIWASLQATAARALDALAKADPTSIEAKRAQVMALGAIDKASRIAGEYGLTPLSRVRLGVQRLAGQTLLARLAEQQDGGAAA